MKRVWVTVVLAGLVCCDCASAKEFKTLDQQLIQAAAKGDLPRVKRLLQRGAKIDVQDETGTTALIHAAREAQLDAMRYLLSKGAALNLQDSEGYTVLGRAYISLREELAARGAKATPKDGKVIIEELIAEMWPGESTTTDSQMKAKISLFVRAGVNLNQRESGEFENTMLTTAASSRPLMVQYLLNLGADPNLADGTGKTPLIHSLDGDMGLDPRIHERAAWHLLSHGAKVTARTKEKESVLHYAVRGYSLGLVRKLIEKGADVDAQDDVGRTPLMVCASAGAVHTAKVLLDSGANPHLKDEGGKTALSHAMNTKFYFVENGAGPYYYQGSTKSEFQRNKDTYGRIRQGRAAMLQLLQSYAPSK